MKIDIKDFQKRYALSNRDMADVCQCSLPTIQKWRSGEVTPAGPARQLMRLLDHNAEGDPTRLREVLSHMAGGIDAIPEATFSRSTDSDISAEEIVDRLELLLESRRKDRQLAESEERYRSMVESIHFPVCRWLPDTSLTYVNQAYADMFSSMGDELLGRKWIEFVPNERRSAVWTLISDVIRRKEPESTMHESIDKDGTLRFQEWWDSPVLNDKGEVVELHSFGHDLTELKSLQRRVTHLEGLISRLLQLCDCPIVVFNALGKIVEGNPCLREKFPESDSADELWKVFPSLSPKRFSRLLERLDGEDKLYVTVSNPSGSFKMRIRSLGEGPDGLRFLALLEDERDLQANGIVKGSTAALSKGMPFCVSGKKSSEKLLTSVQARLLECASQQRVERSFIYLRNPADGSWRPLAEWMEEGLTPLSDEIGEIEGNSLPWWEKRVLRAETIQIDCVNRLPRTAHAEKALFNRTRILSLLAAPLLAGEQVAGFIAFAQTRSGRLWHREEVSALEGLRDNLTQLLQHAPTRK